MTFDEESLRQSLEMAALAYSSLGGQAADPAALLLLEPLVAEALQERIDLDPVLPRSLPRSMDELGRVIGEVGGAVGDGAVSLMLDIVFALAFALARLNEVQQVPLEASITDLLDRYREVN